MFGGALRVAFDMDRKAVIEETVAGREIDCGVLGNEDVEASPVGEVIPEGEFYDYAAKYDPTNLFRRNFNIAPKAG